MLGFLKIACLVLAAACAVSSQSTTDGTCGVYADSLAHPVDCNKYYTLNLHSCPEGQYFNSKTNECDLPQNTKCGQDSTVPTESTSPATIAPTTPPPTTTPPTATTPVTTSPTTTPPTTTPPTTTVPMTTTPVTTPPTTNSPTTPSPTTTPPTTTVPMTTTPVTTPPATTPPATTPPTTTAPTTTPPTTTPPATTAATSQLPTTITTSASTSTSGTTQAPTNGCPAVDNGASRVRYPHETNCNLYYLCTNGNRVLYQCTNSNHFSPIRKICRSVNEAGCDRCPDVPVEGEVVRLPHESVCDFYYRCTAEGTNLYSCAEGLHFSRSERLCVDIEEAKCTLKDILVPVPIY